MVCRSCRDKAASESEDGASDSWWTAVGASAIDALGVSGAGTSSEWFEALREMMDARWEARSHASSVSTSSSRLANVRYESAPPSLCHVLRWSVDIRRGDRRIQDDV